MLIKVFITCFIIVIYSSICFSQTKTKCNIVVLGVTHSAQLVNPNFRPAVLRAFIKQLNPKAICIERSAEEFSRNDFYEFTYEQQYCIVPYAIENSIPLYPFDWMPSLTDFSLVFGTSDLELPEFTRPKNGFKGFVFFNDSVSLKGNLFYADDPAYDREYDWYKAYPAKVHYDFPRRFFLYRTFLQAKKIEHVAKQFANDTILVVVGSDHKKDIEKILSGDGHTIIKAETFGQLTSAQIHDQELMSDVFAILSFNLLGMQYSNYVNTEFTRSSLKKIPVDRGQIERMLFTVKQELLEKKISSTDAIQKYKKLLEQVPDHLAFTWTGVKHHHRLDSYFDPFGNMTVKQRIMLEICREYSSTGEKDHYLKLKELLVAEFDGLKKALLLQYMGEFVEKRK